jgi:hypothetical protein
MVAMYIEAVPNRSSPPAILLRESYREGGKVKKRTLANLSKLPPQVIEGLRTLLRGGVAIEDLSEAVEILDTWPWGHVGAVLGTARKIGIEALLSREPCPERDRVMAMIVARVLDPASKLATARSLGDEAHLVALRAELGLEGLALRPPSVDRGSPGPPPPGGRQPGALRRDLELLRGPLVPAGRLRSLPRR